MQRCLKLGINCLAVTDHNTISGAREIKRIAPFTVIVGEEILSTSGEIIGYFLTEEIPRHLSAEDTVKRIKAQGGLACIPHPFDRFRSNSHLRSDVLSKVMDHIDLIEVFNARTLMLRDSQRALRLAQDFNLPGTAGSDAHIIEEIGKCFIDMPEFNSIAEFKQSLRQGQIFRRRTTPIVHLYNTRNRLIKRLKRS